MNHFWSATSEEEKVARSPGVLCSLLLIRLYRLTLSTVLGRTCRYLPTCSQYGEDAIARYGVWVGGWVTLARVCRCHPLGSHGLDTVPETLLASDRWYTPWRYGRWSGRHITQRFSDAP